MRLALSVPYADVRAADLVLALGHPALPAMGEVQVRLGVYDLTLGVLGHSHQALVTAPGLRLHERVACQPGTPGDLPAARERRTDGHRYAFTSQVTALTAGVAADVCARVAQDPDGLVGIFGDDPDAFTALRAAPERCRGGRDGVAWETWHAYPQSGELVLTTGRVLAP
ncbi:MAG: hypothetical protein JWP18_1424 [Solirubrobacterales bacterium]|nr:hypothetical protein [Solirubrobacterales bacterium]